jgi:microcystin-dependent protein
MADSPFLGELKIVSFNFPPKGWAFCNGQLLPINQNQALFSILGTTYGGDGRVNFGLPNLQGRVPIHMGSGFTLGEVGGEQNHTLTISEMAQHNHLVHAEATTADLNLAGRTPGTTVFLAEAVTGTAANPIPVNMYSGSAPDGTVFDPTAISNTGGNQPHPNMQPYLTLNIIIALQGIFPSQN